MPRTRFEQGLWIALLYMLPIFALPTLWSCTTLHSNRSSNSGFLTDYERLESSGRGEADWWVEPNFDLSPYTALHVPPVELWLSEENGAEVASEDSSRLLNLFHAMTVKKLREDNWEVVSQPSPTALNLKLALTEIGAANRVGNAITGFTPYLAPTVRTLAIAGDVHFFVGRVSTELQITDSQGKVLVEAMDRRVGAHSVLNVGSTWGDVEDAIDLWAERIAQQLKSARNAP